MTETTIYDQTVYDLCQSFLKDTEWFQGLSEPKKHEITHKVAGEVQQALEDGIGWHRPKHPGFYRGESKP